MTDNIVSNEWLNAPTCCHAFEGPSICPQCGQDDDELPRSLG